MFYDSTNGNEEYTTSVTGFINKCIDEIVPTWTVRTYTNQKTWITGNIDTELKSRAATFKERDTWTSNQMATQIICIAPSFMLLLLSVIIYAQSL